MAKPKVPDRYSEPFLFCRTFGHNWRVGEKEEESAIVYRFVLLCDTCHTRRLETIHRRNGSVTGRRYEYPEGYTASRGESVRRTVYRLEFIRRVSK